MLRMKHILYYTALQTSEYYGANKSVPEKKSIAEIAYCLGEDYSRYGTGQA